MNKHILATLAVISLLSVSCKDDNDSSKDCGADYVRCENETLSICKAGVLHEMSCTGDRECRQNDCVKKGDEPQPQQTCGAEFVAGCADATHYQSCVEGRISKIECNCVNNVCKDDSQKTCDEASFVARCDEANAGNRIACVGGVEKSVPCTNGCEGGKCKSDGSGGICGNNKIDGNELCDNWDIGNATCADLEEFKDYPADQLYQGRPRCNKTCDGLEVNTCDVTKCGNGILDAGELCDIGHNGKVLHSTFPSCNDYFDAASRGLTWKPGGEPGCNVNCDGYSKGTCQYEDQPRDGIVECEFYELTPGDYYGSGDTWLQGSIHIKTEEAIDTYDLRGRVACGMRKNPTYEWSFKSEDYMSSVILEPDAEANTADIQTWIDASNWCAASFDCVFQVNSKGGSGSYYNCPIVAGPPAEEAIPEDYLIRKYEIEGQEITGDVIAYWSFDTLGNKNDEIDSAKAESGANASSGVISITEGTNSKKVMRLLSGTCGYKNSLSVSGDGWSTGTSITPSDKHFVVKFSTAGFKNIRVMMHVAVSDTASGQLAATYTVSGITSTADNRLLEQDNKNWKLWSFALDNAGDGNVELDLYTYGNKDPNATFRIDELYILGDRQ